MYVNRIKEVLVGQKARTNIYNIILLENNKILGSVQWCGNWNQYSFMPLSNYDWTESTLRELQVILRNIYIQQKKNSAKGIMRNRL